MTLTPISRELGVGVRTLERLVAQRVIKPVRPGRPGQPALYDPLAVARAILARPLSYRDQHHRAQARLVNLKWRRERGQLLPKADFIRKAQRLAAAFTAAARTLPNRLARVGVPPTEPEMLAAVDELLREIASWQNEDDLLRVAGDA